MRDAGILGWESVAQCAHTRGPLILCGGGREGIDLALSRLGGEAIGDGGRVFWVSARSYDRPLAWAQVAEARIDLEREATAWPAIDPIELNPTCAVRWVAHCLGVVDRGELHILAEVVAGAEREGRRPWAEFLRCVRSRFVERVQETFGAAPQAPCMLEQSEGDDYTDAEFRGHRLTVVSGVSRLMVRSADRLALTLLAFLSESSRYARDARYVVVLDGIWDLLPSAHRRLLLPALTEHARDPYGGLIMTAMDPAGWAGDPEGATLLALGIPLTAPDFAGDWPGAWHGFTQAQSLFPAEDFQVAVPDLQGSAGAGLSSWKWLSAPSPVKHPIRGLRVFDVES